MTMIPVLMDSFGHYAVADLTKKYLSPGNATAVGAGNGPDGRAGIDSANNLSLQTFAFPAASAFYASGRFNTSALSAGVLAAFMDPANTSGIYYVPHIFLTLLADATLQVKTGGRFDSAPFGGEGSVLGTATGPFATSTWYAFEFYGVINAGAGWFKVNINGAPVLDVSGINNCQVANGGGANWMRFDVKVGSSYNMADLVIGQTAEPMGESRVDPHFPNANGSDRDWERSTGDDDYPLVDETAPNTTDYLRTATLNARCSVNLEALRNAGGTIRAVQLVATVTKEDSGPCGVKLYVRPGGAGTRYYSDEFFPSYGSWTMIRWIWPTNPAGGAWDETAFNALEVGIEKTT